MTPAAGKMSKLTVFKVLALTQFCMVAFYLKFYSGLSLSRALVSLTGEGDLPDAANVSIGSFDVRNLSSNIIAIGMAITTKRVKNISWSNIESAKLVFLSNFLTTFCKTASPGFEYRLYLAYDHDDKYLASADFRAKLSRAFHDYVGRRSSPCPAASNYSIQYVRCSYSGKPAWAQNDAMIAAYTDGAEYFFRINDDTRFQTSGWSESFIAVLQQYLPPNVGVVGPKHSGGNLGILTYDFVHRTHIEIFGFYYPRSYVTWYADSWITFVYSPGRMTRVSAIKLRHTMSMGTRYRVGKMMSRKTVNQSASLDKETLYSYVRAIDRRRPVTPDPLKVISMAIWNNTSTVLWGAIRNAQLRSVFYPNWTLRVYVSLPKASPKDGDADLVMLKPNQVIEIMKRLRVDVRLVNASDVPPKLTPQLLNLLALDDPDAKYVLLRRPDMRFSGREASAVNDWLSGNHKPTVAHCMRDQPAHANISLVPGLWAVNMTAFRKRLGSTRLKSLLADLVANVSKVRNSEKQQLIIHDRLWNMFKEQTICHDSISCKKWNNTVPFPEYNKKHEFVGKLYADFHPIKNHEKAVFPRNPDCLPKTQKT